MPTDLTLADLYLRAATGDNTYPADTVDDNLSSVQRDQNWQVFIYLWTQLVTDLWVQTYDPAIPYNKDNNKFVSHDYNSTGLRIWKFINASAYTNKEPGDPKNSAIWEESSISEFIASVGGNIQTDDCTTGTPPLVTIGNNTDLLILDPSVEGSPITAVTINPPTSPRLNKDIRISGGGQVGTGSSIITTITWGTNFTGTHIKGVLPTTMKSGDCFVVNWDGTHYRVVSIYKQ